jgi:hypothetical protein
MNQASFYCQQCQQMKLFQQPAMSHTPHILASVFLCGLWLPIWIIMAITYNPPWRCSFCGFTDSMTYLMNPDLRQIHARQYAEQRQLAAARGPSGFELWWNGINPQIKWGGIIGLILVGVIGVVIASTQLPVPLNQRKSANPDLDDMNGRANRRAFAAAVLKRHQKEIPTLEVSVGGNGNEWLYLNDAKITQPFVDKFWQPNNVVEIRNLGFKTVFLYNGKKTWQLPL